MLGKKDPSKPVTGDDKTMSARHLATRKSFDAKPRTIDNLRASVDYNRKHAEEHLDAIEDRRKDIAKMVKKAGKR